MAYIEHNFFPVKVYVRNEYMYQNQKGHGEFTPAVVLSVRCMPGQAALFQVLLDNGVVRDKLPCHALLTKPESPQNDLPLHYLQIWNTIIQTEEVSLRTIERTMLSFLITKVA